MFIKLMLALSGPNTRRRTWPHCACTDDQRERVCMLRPELEHVSLARTLADACGLTAHARMIRERGSACSDLNLSMS